MKMSREQAIAWLTLEGWELDTTAKAGVAIAVKEDHTFQRYLKKRDRWDYFDTSVRYTRADWDVLSDTQVLSLVKAINAMVRK